jgi:hypothetical protein
MEGFAEPATSEWTLPQRSRRQGCWAISNEDKRSRTRYKGLRSSEASLGEEPDLLKALQPVLVASKCW